jgi:hypothetical protein
LVLFVGVRRVIKGLLLVLLRHHRLLLGTLAEKVACGPPLLAGLTSSWGVARDHLRSPEVVFDISVQSPIMLAVIARPSSLSLSAQR